MKSTALSLFHILHCNADCTVIVNYIPLYSHLPEHWLPSPAAASCNTERHRQAVIHDLCGTTLTLSLCVGDRGAAAGQHR